MITMQRACAGLVLTAALAFALPVRAGEVDKYLPDESEMVVLINVKQLLDAPLVKGHAADKVKELLSSHKEVKTVLDAVGFDPLKDLSSIAVSMNNLPEPKVFVIFHGRFDVAKIQAKAEELVKTSKEKITVYTEGSRKIYENEKGSEKSYMALVDQTTAVVGMNKQAVIDAFAKCDSGKKSNLSKELAELVQKADSKDSFWFGIPTSVISAIPQVALVPQAKETLDKLESITSGVSVGEDVKLRISIGAKTADDAKELGEKASAVLPQAGQVVGSMNLDAKLVPLVTELLNSLKLTTEGKTVTIKGQVDHEVIHKAFQK